MKKTTIQDIADALGISRNTVSKAINNSDGLADATREKILQKAVEMAYKQFSYVASLAGNDSPRFVSSKARLAVNTAISPAAPDRSRVLLETNRGLSFPAREAT